MHVYTPGNRETTVAVATTLPTPPLDLSLDEPGYDPCGQVRIDGQVWSSVGDITRIDWDWDDGGYPFELLTTEQQATMFAVGCSVAAGTDLKARFRDVWGFPIDDQTWAEMYPVIERMIKARYPASNAGEDRVVSLRTGALMDDAFVFNRDQDELTLEWKILQQPPASTAGFDLPTMLNPTFSTDTPGNYVLSLQASSQWVQGDPGTLTITVVDPGIIFSDSFEQH